MPRLKICICWILSITEILIIMQVVVYGTYRTYGRDVEIFLSDLGFGVEYIREDIENIGILNTELYYCRKSK